MTFVSVAETTNTVAGESKAFVRLPLAAELFEVKGCHAFIISPAKSAPGKPWIWYAPALAAYPGAEEKWMFEQFTNAGIAIAGMDVGESYGSPRGRALFSAFYDEMARHRRFSPWPDLLARSRGGLQLYNWAVEHPRCVSAIAGIYPVCDPRSYPGLAKACAAYDMTEAELAAKIDEHCPILRLKPLAQAGVPIFHIHGDSDELVPLAQNSGPLVEAYRGLGGQIELVVAKGQGHNMWTGFFQCQELVDFLIRHKSMD